MSRYSKAQEDRMEEKLLKAGFELVEDTARRKKHEGDRVMKHMDSAITFTIDHKSTTGKEGIRLQRGWLDKIKREARPGTVPAITISFKDCRKMYVVFDLEELGEVL